MESDQVSEADSFRPGRSQPRVMVMFCDLVGSTELSERHEPERYGMLIERFISKVRATLEERYGGQVVGIQGDGVLAVFGAPDAYGDDAERAVRAALEVIDVVKVLSDDTQREVGEKLVGSDRHPSGSDLPGRRFHLRLDHQCHRSPSTAGTAQTAS